MVPPLSRTESDLALDQGEAPALGQHRRRIVRLAQRVRRIGPEPEPGGARGLLGAQQSAAQAASPTRAATRACPAASKVCCAERSSPAMKA